MILLISYFRCQDQRENRCRLKHGAGNQMTTPCQPPSGQAVLPHHGQVVPPPVHAAPPLPPTKGKIVPTTTGPVAPLPPVLENEVMYGYANGADIGINHILSFTDSLARLVNVALRLPC